MMATELRHVYAYFRRCGYTRWVALCKAVDAVLPVRGAR